MVDDRSQIWSAHIGRQQLVELLDGRGPQLERVRPDSIAFRHGGLTAIWIGSERNGLGPLPSVIVGEQPELDELIAWSSTYLRSLGPLGALTRLMTPDRLTRLMDGNAPPEHPWRLAAGAVGLICGEILAQLGTADVASAASANPVGTLSFAVCKAWSLGVPPPDLSEVASNYGSLMQIIQRKFEPRRLRNIETIAACLTGARTDRDRSSLRAMSDLLSGNDILSVAGEVLRRSTDLLNANNTSRLSEMTAEDRVQFFDAIAPSLIGGHNGADELDSAFALALAAFICRPGMEQQVGLLGEHARRAPTSLLWLGALQSLATNGDMLSTGDGAGWRIGRELFRPDQPLAAPKADVSLMELTSLARSKSKAFDRLTTRPRLDVEIYPMITVGIRGNGRREEAQRNVGFEGANPDLALLRLVGAKLEQALGMLKEFSEDPAANRKPPSKRKR